MRRGRHVLDLPVSLPSIVSLCESCAVCRFSLSFAGHTRARAPLTRVIMRSFARLFVVALAGTRVAADVVRGTVDTIQAWKYIRAVLLHALAAGLAMRPRSER